MKINNLSLQGTILIAAIILGGTILASQLLKQNSIEKQQTIELNAKSEQAKSEEDKKYFENNIKCNTLLKDLRQRWNNVVGIYYDVDLNTCIVKYTKDGIVEEAPIENMQDD